MNICYFKRFCKRKTDYCWLRRWLPVDKETRKIEFYKKHEGDNIWHVRYVGLCGHQAISFDKKKILFLFGDYPKNFTKEEKALFDKENPYWANFFNKD